jgi:hypothetical protein
MPRTTRWVYGQGEFEIKNLINQVKKLVFGNFLNKDLIVSVCPPYGYGEPTTYMRKHIYMHPPHIVFNNHFYGDNVLDYAGKWGFGLTQTCHHKKSGGVEELHPS